MSNQTDCCAHSSSIGLLGRTRSSRYMGLRKAKNRNVSELGVCFCVGEGWVSGRTNVGGGGNGKTHLNRPVLVNPYLHHFLLCCIRCIHSCRRATHLTNQMVDL